MPDPLGSVRAKLRRAQHHLDALQAAAQVFADGHPYGLETQRDAKYPDNLHKVIVWVQDVPEELSLLAGDAINNIRSALDHMAYQLVIANHGTPTHRTTFPIHDADPMERKRDPREVRVDGGITEKALGLIRGMQPYLRPDPLLDPLSILGNLSNRDKHRLLLLTVSTYDRVEFAYDGHTGVMPPTQLFPVIIGRQVGTLAGPDLIEDYMQTKLSIRIALEESLPGSGKPIGDVIEVLLQSVRDGIVPALSRYLR